MYKNKIHFANTKYRQVSVLSKQCMALVLNSIPAPNPVTYRSDHLSEKYHASLMQVKQYEVQKTLLFLLRISKSN